MGEFPKIIATCFLFLAIMGCGTRHDLDPEFHFTRVDGSATGIRFNNKISESDSVNVFVDEYMYNGAGVGIGDFNNDGLQDIYFAGSMTTGRLYINQGGFRFEDLTAEAGLETDRWCTGVSVVDINNDGWQDIYVCTSHFADPAKRKNLLYINDGHLHFTEQAAEYGLADTGFSTQAAFLDYDRDGDLDMYLVNHRIYSHTANDIQPRDLSGNSPASDHLYRNEGNQGGHPFFTDVSRDAGILEDGYGLGIVVSDVNNDQWPDIYVANDYIADDLLWLNDGNGHFTNAIAASVRHASYNSMGVDAADLNNDERPDIITLDMLPEENRRKKMMFSNTNQEKFEMRQRYGYEPAYMRNMLQVNDGVREWNGRHLPVYSEIGQLAGIAETDWSWSVLMADFNNDGWKDIHITNGLGKDVTNNDYATFRTEQPGSFNYSFNGNSTGSSLVKQDIKAMRKEIDAYGAVPMNNYFFLNRGELRFENTSSRTGIDIPSISNGAAYADLDNDGDLDLVVNNINQEAFVWRNELRKNSTDTLHSFINIELNGPGGNRSGYNSQVFITAGGTTQMQEQSPVRGFSSSVDARLHFGVGNAKQIDSIRVRWPDGKQQVLRQVNANQFLKLDYQDAGFITPATQPPDVSSRFMEDASGYGIEFKHAETPNFDFGNRQPLFQRYSQLGPCIATADVNGDGLDDFFVGGAANQSGKIFIQQKDGRFAGSDLVQGLKPGEDLGAVFFDADRDGDVDLLVTGGSLEFTVAKYNQPVLYLNNGRGSFTPAEGAIPEITAITKAVDVADIDGDGWLDIFIGGRVQPGRYPESPRSYILKNEHGRFRDVTQSICADLAFGGMIDAALFTDFDQDQQPDLVVCGEWTPIRFFHNVDHKLVEVTETTGLEHMNGWWRSLQQVDIDHDGDTDFVAGNMGSNNLYRPTAAQPMMLYYADMDLNGSLDLVPAYYIKDETDGYRLFPAVDRNQLSDQVPLVKKKYLRHETYAGVTMSRLQSDLGGETWQKLVCETSESVWIENLGDGKFKTHSLPDQAQWAPVNAILADDFDGDGHTDLLLAGNEYQSSAAIGRYDASLGLVLKGDGSGHFVPEDPGQTGLWLDGDIKCMRWINIKEHKKAILIAPNDDNLKMFILN